MAGWNGIHNSGLFPNHLDRDFDKSFFDGYKRSVNELDALQPVYQKATSSYIQEMDTIGLRAVQQMYEGQPVPFERVNEGYTKQITFDIFGLAMQFTEVAWEDDQYGDLKKAPAELGKAMTLTKDLKFWDLLNSGFVSTTRSGWDSLPLFDDSHPLQGAGLSGTTLDNDGTGALSMSTLQTALNHFEDMVNDQNVPTPFKGKKLLVIPSGLVWKAKELLLSEYNPENANMQKNTLDGEEIQYYVSHYLTSSTAWFLVMPGMHDLRWIWRRNVKTGTYTDFATGNAMFKVNARWQTDFIRWRGVYGNTGV
jgi:hypothetical protein